MAKKKLKKKVRLVVTLLIGFLLIGGIFFLLEDKTKGKFDTNIKKITSPKKKEEVWPKVYTSKLVASGDGLPHNALYRSFYNKETDTFDFTEMTSEVNDIVKSYDIAYYNQETVFGGKRTEIFNDTTSNVAGYYGGGPDSLVFNSPSEFGDAMIKAGFNMVSLASNHSADCRYNSETCLKNSYAYWETQAKEKGVIFDGFNADETKENKYNTFEKNGIKYGFLDYTDTLNGLDGGVRGIEYLIDRFNVTDATNGTCPDGYTYTGETDSCISSFVTDEVTDLRSKVDVLIVAVHGHQGSREYSFTPTQINKNIALYLNSLGVDIVLGTYSHCLQPFDVIGDDHKTTVFYSLGNFISNQLDLNLYNGYHPYVGAIGVLAGMEITMTVEKDGTKKIEIGNYEADLIYSFHNKSWKNYKAVPFSKMTTEYLSDDLAKSLYEEYSSYLTAYNSDIKIAPIGSKLS